MKKRILRSAAAAVLLALLAAAVWTGFYYRAEPEAEEALASGGGVSVSRESYGWSFDGPGDEVLLVFYPGAKVEETAYAPLMRLLAEGGLDCRLLKVPARLAILDADAASGAIEGSGYARVYAGGHSLGGACSTAFASRHPGEAEGVVLLAAYPMKELGEDIEVISVRGTEDGVLDLERYENGMKLAAGELRELLIQGGNHAQFGSYGPQKGDGEPLIAAEEQLRETADFILDCVLGE